MGLFRLSCLLICAAFVVSEAANIARHGNMINEEGVGDEHKHKSGLALLQPAGNKKSHYLKWSSEDKDKSNERNIWISHPKPKIYNGPDTKESETGIEVPKNSIWVVTKRFSLPVRRRRVRKNMHKNTSADIF